ncbi:MAG: glycosyltransferase [Flavobacterium sp.]|nr:glycosyltransferase [Flavobacterium sp.]
MDTKKILVVSSAFYPENSPRSFRTTELVKELARQGHSVTLYTLKKPEFHTAIEKEFGIVIKDLGTRKMPIINVGSGAKPIVLMKRIINRALLQLISYPDIELMFMVKKALKKEKGTYDLLISIAVPHSIHWGTAWARTKSHPLAKKWVADCGDPFMGAIHDSFKKVFYFKYLEKWFCKKADYIAVPKLAMKETYYPEFRNKVIEIPQGFKFDEVVLNNFTKNDVPTFGFAGTFVPTTRNPTPLLEYLATVEAPFKFIIYTETQDLVLPFIPILKEKLELRRYVPRMELLKELSSMDFLVNISYDPVHQAPSKLIDYYLTRRPILSSASSIFETAIVAEFLKGDYKNAFVFDNIEQYKIENVAKSFLYLVKE